MFVQSKSNAEMRERNGLTSYFMFGRGEAGETALAVTWVDIVPHSQQRLHNHPEIQVYVIIAGQGLMHVGAETRHVQAGDLIYIPTNLMHGIENTGSETLSYISAANPAFDLAAAYDRGQLIPEAYEKPAF